MIRPTSLLLCLSASLGFAQDARPLQLLMSPQDYQRTGAWRLDPAEQASLAAWMGGLRAQEPAPATSFRSRVDGDWEGWKEGAAVKLVNGQVWQQVETVFWEHNFKTEPSITVALGADGAWYMAVDGMSRSVRVKRVR